MSLLDPDRFAGHKRKASDAAPPASDPGELMRRLMKEQLVKFDGRPLFPPRFAYVVPYDLSDSGWSRSSETDGGDDGASANRRDRLA